MINDHAGWQCPFCDDAVVYDVIQDIVNHLLKDHIDISSDDLPGLLSLASEHGMGIKSCPLCGESGPQDSPELVMHVMEHMHEFSLLSLPWSMEEADADFRSGTQAFDLSHPVFSSPPRLSSCAEIRLTVDVVLQRQSLLESLRERLEGWFGELELPDKGDEEVRKLMEEYETWPASTADGDALRGIHPTFFIGRTYFSLSTIDGSVGTSISREGTNADTDPDAPSQPIQGLGERETLVAIDLPL